MQMLSKRTDIKLILYTCSYPDEQDRYVKYFKKHDIHFTYVNKNPEVKTGQDNHGYYIDKPYINVLLDDKSGFNPEGEENDWEIIREVFKRHPEK